MLLAKRLELWMVAPLRLYLRVHLAQGWELSVVAQRTSSISRLTAVQTSQRRPLRATTSRLTGILRITERSRRTQLARRRLLAVARFTVCPVPVPRRLV